MAASFETRAPLRGIAEDEERQGRYAVAVLAQLALHFLCFFSNVSTLVVCAYFGEYNFFLSLLFFWLVAAVLISWAALREMQPWRGGSGCRLIRWLWVVLVYGFLRGLQVRHICRFFHQRWEAGRASGEGHSNPSLEPSAFNSKTFDGILEGLAFAIGSQYAFFMLDASAPSCDWYMRTDRVDSKCRFIFLASAVSSMMTLAAAIVEVDFRVSTDIHRRIRQSPLCGFIHFMFRASEVTFSITLFNLVGIFLRPELEMTGVPGPLLLYAPEALVWLIRTWMLYRSARSQSADSEFLLAHMAVAFAAIVVNPIQFVDRPVYQQAAQKVTRVFTRIRLVEFLVQVAFIALSWKVRFPCNVQGNGAPTSVGDYTMWSHSNHRLAYVELGAAMVVHLTIVASHPYARQVVFSRPSSSRQPALRGQDRSRDRNASVAFLATTAPGRPQAEVRRSLPRGLSSFVVQAGTGVSSSLFASPDHAVTDFVVERQLGMGAYGVVLKVQSRWHGGEPLPEDRQVCYAMKLSHVSGPWQATYAEREREYLVRLNLHRHPFIMRLKHFMDVDQDREFYDADGRRIPGSFHKALMMEYCALGDLHAYLLRNALVAHSPNQPPADGENHQSSREWLDTARRLCAQLMEAIRFLHGENFSHRDLKPSNVLLKSGRCGLYVCIADFGFAKQAQPGQQLESVAGDLDYMAPEIRAIYGTGRWTGTPYTLAVDLFSLGKLTMAILWGAKCDVMPRGREGEAWALQLPTEAEWKLWSVGHPRVPPPAKELVDQMLQEIPSDRGTAEKLALHNFFKSLEHNGMQLPALDFSNCQRTPELY